MLVIWQCKTQSLHCIVASRIMQEGNASASKVPHFTESTIQKNPEAGTKLSATVSSGR